ncbi:hypothetical protein ACG04R_26260 [Roseateles sp. BYS78W]|uniref:Uncharacterized protein n=1 Tax=Pelomonas candidula TaxID=3299025 RepID=A0ABW7HKL5_9BURK
MRRRFLGLALAGAATAASAQASLVSSLSRCDAAFFQQLSTQKEALRPQAEIKPRAAASSFIVPSLTQPGSSRVTFGQPLRLHGLEIVGYLDELTPIPGGVDVSWGFLVRGKLADVVAALKGVIWDGQRLRQQSQDDMPYFVRSEIWRHEKPDSGWAKEATVNGPPKPGTVERVFMIETDEDDHGLVRAACSLQGDVTREMLQDLRPDFPVDGK